MLKAQTTTSVFLLSFAFLANAKNAKPKLEQVYIIDQKDVYGPVKTKYNDELKGEKVLKNPDFGAKVNSSQIVYHEKKKAAEAKKTPQEFVPKKLKFKTMAVGGRKADPRLKFEQDPILLQRVDEPLAVDFYRKIFDENKLEY